MILFLTGANSSLIKTTENPQTDPNKSLGGFVSSTIVPNNSINSLFDTVSPFTLEKRLNETIGIGLVNKFNFAANDIELKLVSNNHSQCEYLIGAVSLDNNLAMEHISSRYQEPLSADFYDATFYRAFVEIEIKKSGSVGETINIQPFNVNVQITESGIEGTWNAFEEAFYNSEEYSVSRISENVFRIERNDEMVVEYPIVCSYTNSGDFSAEFLGKYQNLKSNSVSLGNINPGGGIGIWIQRRIKKSAYKNDQQLIELFKKKQELNNLEKIEIIINYNNND